MARTSWRPTPVAWPDFVAWLVMRSDFGRDYGIVLSHYQPGSREFSAEWLALAETDPDGFGRLQDEFCHASLLRRGGSRDAGARHRHRQHAGRAQMRAVCERDQRAAMRANCWPTVTMTIRRNGSVESMMPKSMIRTGPAGRRTYGRVYCSMGKRKAGRNRPAEWGEIIVCGKPIRQRLLLALLCLCGTILAGYWLGSRLSGDRGGIDAVRADLRRIEEHQQRAADRLDTISKGLDQSVAVTQRISGRVTEAANAISNVEERVTASRSRFEANAKLLDSGESILEAYAKEQKKIQARLKTERAVWMVVAVGAASLFSGQQVNSPHRFPSAALRCGGGVFVKIGGNGKYDAKDYQSSVMIIVTLEQCLSNQ